MQNSVITGNVGADAEVKTVGNSDVVNFQVAETERWTNASGEKKDRTTWYKVAKWFPIGKGTIAKYLTKGTKVVISGRLDADSYAKNGEIVQVLRMTANHIELMGGGAKPEEQQNEATPRRTYTDEELESTDLPF